MKSKNYLTLAGIYCASFVSAATISISDFNAGTSANTATVGGSTTGLTVSIAGTGSTSDNYIYTVSYSNQDFDGDGNNDTVTFDIRVKSFSGGTISGADATIGTTEISTNISGNKWFAGGDTLMSNAETVAFSLENFQVSTFTGASRSIVFESYDDIYLAEGGGYSHDAVFGQGTGLQDAFNNNDINAALTNYTDPTLYISSASGANPRDNWGIRDFGFTINVVPEPSSLALLAIGLGGLAFYRRRQT